MLNISTQIPVFGSRIRAALHRRYGSSFCSPRNNGRMLRAACLVLGCKSIPKDDTPVSSPFSEESDFVAAVHSKLPYV